ncbi:hypothetical protein BDN70DRAFT_896376 [Pholiota conissans]|uniref:Uncharacterized protein n=1 Tax=Pholiota conissans TaxID=109636 RepID=A0A9P5YYP5_9AGAR|nr:hypothetical protein BDN70DRAFT_896376 [Pholiota conissans]
MLPSSAQMRRIAHSLYVIDPPISSQKVVRAASLELQRIWDSSQPQIENSEYFLIGQYVLVKKRSERGGWKPAEVVRPFINELFRDTGNEERIYEVRFIGYKEGIDLFPIGDFDPKKDEIRAMPTNYYSYADFQLPKVLPKVQYKRRDFVWAVIDGRWLPSMYIVRLRAFKKQSMKFKFLQDL